MNSSQIANIAARVKPLAVLLLVAACGSPAGSDTDFRESPEQGTAGSVGSSGSGAMAGEAGSAGSPMTAGSSGNATAGAPAAGAGGAATSAGMGGTAGASEGQAGATNGGSSGAAAAGAGGSSGGHAGAGQAGSAGKPATDPLDPKPVDGCPGYVKVIVPHGTCVWIHGSFSSQSEQCDVVNPSTRSCATASAPGADTTTIVSVGAEITRLDFDATGCPKKCN